jgi:hypothetical protein
MPILPSRYVVVAGLNAVSPVRLEIGKSSQVEIGTPMKDLYYFAAWTDCGCLCGCNHQHNTVASAVACSAPGAAGYVVAVERGQLRSLTEEEEIEFQRTNYGWEPVVVESTVRNVLVRVTMFIRIQTESQA